MAATVTTMITVTVARTISVVVFDVAECSGDGVGCCVGEADGLEESVGEGEGDGVGVGVGLGDGEGDKDGEGDGVVVGN